MSKAFGEQNTIYGETAVSWQTWSDGAGNVPTITGDADWGKLKLDLSGEEGRSAVYDLGSETTRRFTLTENRYGTGEDDATLQYRTSTSPFNQDDETPAWTTYSVPFSVNCRYVQIRETTLSVVIYYVDATGGDDDNDGLTPDNAWQTIAKVNAGSFSPGDHILLKCGETWNERLVLPSGGSISQRVVLSSYGTGDDPIIDGNGIDLTYSQGLLEIKNKDYVLVEGINVINSDSFGIYVYSSDYVNVIGCSTDNTTHSGIYVYFSTQIRISNNTVVDARNVTGGAEESISIVGTTYFEVDHNDVSMSGGTGQYGNEAIDCKDGARFGSVHHNYCHDFVYPAGGAIYCDAWDSLTGDIDIYCNKVFRNPNGIAFNGEQGGTLENINVYNNQIYSVSWAGIAISKTGSNGLKRNINIYHNSIYKTVANGGAGIYVYSDNVENIIIKNNITYFQLSNGQIVACTETGGEKCVVQYNMTYGSHSCALDCVDCEHMSDRATNITDDPEFVSLITPDLHLQETSPAKGAGTPLEMVTTDYDGNPRGNPPSIGAFE